MENGGLKSPMGIGDYKQIIRALLRILSAFRSETLMLLMQEIWHHFDYLKYCSKLLQV